MKIWFDTEFIDDGKTIDLISIGMVREDGAELYMESAECDISRASDWVKRHVCPHLSGQIFDRKKMADNIIAFAGQSPEFWGWYADYDWVALCQLYGSMMSLPNGWPLFCRDVQQLLPDDGTPRISYPRGRRHHALDDARYEKALYDAIMRQEIHV